MVLDIFDKRYGSKLAEMLKNQPMTNLLLLNAAVDLFEGDGDEKYLPITRLYQQTLRECDRLCGDRMTFQDFLQCLEKLEDYSFFKSIKNKKDPKLTTIALAVDINELEKELKKREEQELNCD